MKVHETTMFFLVILLNIRRLKKFTYRLSNKPILIWLLTTPPHFKYVVLQFFNLRIFGKITRQECGCLVHFLNLSRLRFVILMINTRRVKRCIIIIIPCITCIIAWILTLMFHKVVWQHMQGVVGFLVTSLLQILRRNLLVTKFCKSVKIWHSYGHKFVASLFGPP